MTLIQAKLLNFGYVTHYFYEYKKKNRSDKFDFFQVRLSEERKGSEKSLESVHREGGSKVFLT